MDYEEVAARSRYSKVSTWLRETKPKLDHLTYNGAETGYYKCVTCAEYFISNSRLRLHERRTHKEILNQKELK